MFLKKESKKVKDLDYINIEYQQMGKYVDKPDVCEQLVQKVLEYRQIEKNVQETQQSINELIRIREQLMKTSEEGSIFEDGKCGAAFPGFLYYAAALAASRSITG